LKDTISIIFVILRHKVPMIVNYRALHCQCCRLCVFTILLWSWLEFSRVYHHVAVVSPIDSINNKNHIVSSRLLLLEVIELYLSRTISFLAFWIYPYKILLNLSILGRTLFNKLSIHRWILSSGKLVLIHLLLMC